MKDDIPMTKDGSLRAGHSPCELTGKVSDTVEDGVAIKKEKQGSHKDLKTEADLDIPLD